MSAAHFFDHAVGEHLFHSAIDTLVKFCAIAKNKDTARFRAGRRDNVGDGLAREQANLERADQASRILPVDRLRRIRIELRETNEQFVALK